jgi:ribonuclease HI
MVKEPIIIYADGSADNNKTRCGGYGAVLIYKEKRKEIYGGEKDTTNNRMEIVSVIKALEEIKSTNIPIKIHSDSAYVVNCFQQKWYSKWEYNGWTNSKKQPVENQDLWEILIKLVRKQKYLEFVKVKGHSNVELNEVADKLAGKGRKEIENE